MSLPVDAIREDLVSSIRDTGRLLLKAPTGSGKSTCVPQMLLDAEVEGLILVVQPRRMAARMLAQYVARLQGVRHGDEVGHVVRFENKTNAKTKIIYLTDGVLQRWLNDDPDLSKVGAVVFDEFHERRIASDVALARCLELQDREGSKLKVVVMSATIEMAGLKDYLEPCKYLETDGRTFPVEISYAGSNQNSNQTSRSTYNGARKLEIWNQVADAVSRQVFDAESGNILVFLPGVYEIQKTKGLIERSGWSKDCDIYPLYSSLSPKDQEQALSGGSARKRIILSTNVAETSLTIPGVRTVIDAGLARISRYDPVRGIDTLMVDKISRAAADQRAGRAGRTATGRCIRLWSEADHARRSAFELPEIHRVDLTEVTLSLKALGVSDISGFRWLDKPDAERIAYSENLLNQLGAVDEIGAITKTGQMMLSFPLHPRYSRLLLLAEEYGCVAEVGFITAALQCDSIFTRGKKGQHASGRDDFTESTDSSDFVAEWRAYQYAEDVGFDTRRCSESGIMARSAREISQSFKQLKQFAERHSLHWGKVDFDASSEMVKRCMLEVFSDHLAVRMSESSLSSRVVGKRRGNIDQASIVRQSRFFIAVEVREVEGREVTVYLSRCIAMDMETIREVLAGDLVDSDSAVYNATSRRVEKLKELKYRDLILESKEGGEPPLDIAAQLLAEQVAAGELKLKQWDHTVDRWVARLVNLTTWMPELELPGFGESDRLMFLEEVCQGAKSYKEIKNREIRPVMDSWLSTSQKAVLDAYAPLEITLEKKGKDAKVQSVKAKVKYALDQEPYIAMRLQHLYDVSSLPAIANGSVKIKVHILAPNQRPWQITADLEAFWESGYSQMKKDLAGRYPKHEWR